MDEVTKQHLTRLRMATTGKLGLGDLPRWIEENTYINNKNFSFVGHEYQKRILLDKSPELVIRKSAQTGISEMAMRKALGLLMIMPGAFRIGYTFPSASFAEGYAKTRLNPIIASSPALRAASSSSDIDTSGAKTFGQGKELYFKGAAVGNAAISTTLDLLIHDETSFSDPEILGDYWSRLQHSAYQWRTQLSTPTFPGDLIDDAFRASRRHWNFCRCTHCSHAFIPDYYTHVNVPGLGMGKDLDTVTSTNLHLYRYEEAQLLCPKCGREADLSPENREWVCENPTETHIAAGYQVQPFDAPTIVTLPKLIIASTKYNSRSKFKQFALGLPAEDADNGLMQEDLDRIGINMVQSPFSTHVLGIDLGVFCHFMVGGVDSQGVLVVVHYERVALKNFRTRYAALCAEYRISVKVSDIQPYTDLIMSISATDPNLFGARYVSRAGLEIYDVRSKEHDVENAIEGVREVSVNRNAVFDKLMSEIRPAEGSAPGIMIRKCEDWHLIVDHLTDMKRATATVRSGEFTSVWQKSNKGADHYHHALGYLWLASQLRSFVSGTIVVPMGIHKFKLKGDKPRR